MKLHLSHLLLPSLLPLLLFAAPAGQAQTQAADANDPVLWPEAQRAFFQDGPGLLLSTEQRQALRTADEAGRTRLIQEFLARNPGPGVTAQQLRDGIDRRQRLAAVEFGSPDDVRAQLVFLNGPPTQRIVIDCGTSFKPIEIWTYRAGAPPGNPTGAATPADRALKEASSRSSFEGSLVLFRPAADEPFRPWVPSESKRMLYSSEMEYWLEQWEELRGEITVKRFDLQMCKEARLIDRATGIAGLTGARTKLKEGASLNSHYGQRPDAPGFGTGTGEGLLDPPGDLAAWARAAAAVVVPPGPPRLVVNSVDLEFPERAGQRILTRALVQVVPTGRIDSAEREPEETAAKPPAAEPAASGAKGAPGTPGTPGANGGGGNKGKGKAGAKPPGNPTGNNDGWNPHTQPAAAAPAPLPAAAPLASAGPVEKTGRMVVSLTVEGVMEHEGKVFEHFRFRYRIPAPAPGQPAALALDRPLRSRLPFVMRLRIRDNVSGAVAKVSRGFVVPEAPVQVERPLLAAALPADLDAAKHLSDSPGSGKDSLTLLPPESDVVLGLWRADALVTGDRIAKVKFLVDGKLQLARSSKPYSVEVRLARFPVEQVVRAEGYEASGKLVAADEVVLNQQHGGLHVAIMEPPRGGKQSGTVHARAEVIVPEERHVESVEFKVNETVVAKLKSPPWQVDLKVPNEETVYLSVVATLDDGSRSEDVRFLRSPQYVEEIAVNLIELYVAVTDHANQPVRGLTADDFQVLEGGKPQKIDRFELVENLPLTLGIMIDTSGSMASSLGEAQRAASTFLQRMVRKQGDRCFTLTFSDRPVVRMPLTDDVGAAIQSLDGIQAVGETSIHDALVHSLYYFRGTRGQRALVLLSDGDDNSSELTFDEALEYAKRSGVSIYVIGLNISSTEFSIRSKLNRLSETTGGRVFFVSKAQELVGAYDEIERELRSRYLLAFNSNLAAGEGGFRQVEVKVKKGGLKTRTARGYYP